MEQLIFAFVHLIRPVAQRYDASIFEFVHKLLTDVPDRDDEQLWLTLKQATMNILTTKHSTQQLPPKLACGIDFEWNNDAQLILQLNNELSQNPSPIWEAIFALFPQLHNSQVK